MNKKRLKNYARLIAKAGVNVQKGQEVLITADLDQPEFVRMVVDECYRLGASKVTVDWNYQPLMRSHVRYCSEKVLGHLDDWQIEKWEHQAKVLPCKIYLLSEDPDGLNGINQKKYAAAMRERSRAIKPIRDRMAVVYRRRARERLGEKALPRYACEHLGRKAVVGDPRHLARRRRSDRRMG